MSKNKNETKKTNVIALTDKLPLIAPAERPAREKKPPGTLLMSALSDRARERGHDETALARDLQVTYGYVQQLRKGIRAVNTISDGFAEACAPYLEVPRLQVWMLAERITPQDYFRSADLYEQDVIRLFGQELNDESYAICKADMLIKGQDPKNIVRGNTLSADGFAGEKFDYGAANPPFGVDWKKVQDVVKAEYEKKGFAGRFGPGLPRVSDGSLLFLMHLISKMRPAAEGGGRIGIVLNGSPLFTGDAGSGESEIRRWVLENDLLEAIIALPNDLFYNTGIATYVWVLSNHKKADRKSKVQLIDATRMYSKMKKGLGNKRVYITDAQIEEIVKVYAGNINQATFRNEFVEVAKSGNLNGQVQPEPARIVSKVFDSKFFGYRKVTVDRPPQDGKPTPKLKKGQKPFDPERRDTENVPLTEDITAYMKREVLPHVPDAYVNEEVRDEKDGQVGKVGYEINLNRYFYDYKPPRKPHVIAKEISEMEKRFMELMKGVLA